MGEIVNKRARGLINRFLRDRNIKLTDFDDMDFVDFLRDKVVPNIVPSTWAAYRQAIKVYISEPAYQKLLLIPARKRKGRPKKTSATRAKKLDLEDIKLLDQRAKSKGKKPSEIGVLVGKALCVGVVTGMRPHEWNHAHFDGNRLIIENVKLNKCTEKIWAARQLDMSHIEPETVDGIKAFLKEIQTSDVEFSIKRKSLTAWLSRADKCLFPRRKRHITLMSARHQFIANLKKSERYSPAEIAYLAGHASDWRAFESYGRKSSGDETMDLPTIPEDQQSEVKKVALHFKAKMENRVERNKDSSLEM